MPLTIPQTQTILQSYFQTTDIPTQDQFLELIGTMFYLYNGMLAAATAATAAATALSAQVAASSPVVVCSVDSSPEFIGTATGVSSVEEISHEGSAAWQVNFTTPFANTNYRALISPNLSGVPGVVAQQNVGSIVILYPTTGEAGLAIAIWQ